MMKKAIVVVVLLASLLQIVLAQTIKRPSTKPKPHTTEKPAPKQPAEIHSTEPFNTDLQILPVGYRGHDAKRIYDIFQERLTPKGEFETTEAYDDRIIKASLLPLVGSLTISHLFAFELDRAIFEYDADKELLIVGADFWNVDDGTALRDSYRGLTLEAGGDSKQETYEGSNAYGAKATIQKTTIRKHELAVRNWENWQTEDYVEPSRRKSALMSKYLARRAILNKLNLAPAQAETLKPNFRLLAICRLKYPLIGRGGTYRKPTFDVPHETAYFAKYLYADLIELWAYDLSNGKVLYKRRSGAISQ